MRLKNIGIGIIWVCLAYFPAIAWYVSRRNGSSAVMASNRWYNLGWQFMWISHYLVFQLPAIVFPLTLLGSQTINQFYILVNYWLGTLAGGVVASITALFWLVAIFTYTSVSGGPSLGIVITQLSLYLLATFGAWFAAYKLLVPGAYEWLQLTVEE